MKLFVLLLPVLLATGCRFAFDKTVEGNTHIKTEDRSVGSFTNIEVGGPFQVMVTQGSNPKVTVTADDNLMEYIDIKTNGQTLEIRERDNFNLRGTKGLQVMVQVPEVRQLTMAGSGTISATSTLKSNSTIGISLAGSGKIQAEVNAPEIDFDLGGSGSATLSGQTRKIDITIGGSGDCLAEALKSEDCSVTIGGSGTAKVYASQNLNVSIGGSGNVEYAGQPKITQSIGGSGKVKQL